MAVQVWVGEKPEHPNERRAIVALANGLDRLDGLYLILANFSVGGNNVDLMIIKPDAVFIIELKHCDGKVFGGVNGHWYVESANGERKRLNPGRKNPYNQVIAYFYAINNFLNEHRREFLSEQKSGVVDFRTCRRVVVIAPMIQEGSQIDLDWKVELKGLDELPSYLVTERSSEIDLTDEEMLAIPQLLRLARWKEINNLIDGVLPGWERAAELLEIAENPPPPSPPVQPAPPPPSPPARSLLQRARAAMRTTTGRLAVAATTLALALLLLLLTRPMQVVIPLPDQPSLVNQPVASPIGGAAALDTGGCIWSGYQPVAKRWDNTQQLWISVGVDGAVSSAPPDVVVTLEQVAYCSNNITLTWSVLNNGTRAVELPLRNDNISIQDVLGNEYPINDAGSKPSALQVAPGEQASGTVVLLRPLNQNASSLLIRLKKQPFGEASWLVSINR